jgi:hypothetical protein
MNAQRLEIVLPADVPARDCAAVAHAIWVVLDAAGLDEGSSVQVVEDESGTHSPASPGTV